MGGSGQLQQAVGAGKLSLFCREVPVLLFDDHLVLGHHLVQLIRAGKGERQQAAGHLTLQLVAKAFADAHLLAKDRQVGPEFIIVAQDGHGLVGQGGRGSRGGVGAGEQAGRSQTLGGQFQTSVAIGPEDVVRPIEDEFIPAPVTLADSPGGLAGHLNQVRVGRVKCPLAGRLNSFVRSGKVINRHLVLSREGFQLALRRP